MAENLGKKTASAATESLEQKSAPKQGFGHTDAIMLIIQEHRELIEDRSPVAGVANIAIKGFNK